MSEDLRSRILEAVRDAFRTGKTAEATDAILALLPMEGEPVAYGWSSPESGVIIAAMDGPEVESWRKEAQKRPGYRVVPLYATPQESADEATLQLAADAIASIDQYRAEVERLRALLERAVETGEMLRFEYPACGPDEVTCDACDVTVDHHHHGAFPHKDDCWVQLARAALNTETDG